MPEYINKTKFLEQLNSELSEISTVYHDHIDLEKQMYEFVIKKVEEMESEDVEIVKHGHWRKESGMVTLYQCSECNCYVSEERYYDYVNDIMRYPKYCEHCGAKMDGVEGNSDV